MWRVVVSLVVYSRPTEREEKCTVESTMCSFVEHPSKRHNKMKKFETSASSLAPFDANSARVRTPMTIGRMNAKPTKRRRLWQPTVACGSPFRHPRMYVWFDGSAIFRTILDLGFISKRDEPGVHLMIRLGAERINDSRKVVTFRVIAQTIRPCRPLHELRGCEARPTSARQTLDDVFQNQPGSLLTVERCHTSRN